MLMSRKTADVKLIAAPGYVNPGGVERRLWRAGFVSRRPGKPREDRKTETLGDSLKIFFFPYIVACLYCVREADRDLQVPM